MFCTLGFVGSSLKLAIENSLEERKGSVSMSIDVLQSSQEAIKLQIETLANGPVLYLYYFCIVCII